MSGDDNVARQSGGPYRAASLLVFSAALLLQLCSRNQLGPFSNLFVPDGITLATSFEDYWNGLLLEQDISWGLPINYIYYPAYLAGVLGFAAVNISLIIVVKRVCNFQVFQVLFAIPYFIIAIALPSKDLLMLLASFLVVRAALKDQYAIAIVISVLAFTIRDGALIIFLGFIFLWKLYRMRPKLLPILVGAMFASAAMLDFVAQELFGDLFIYARNQAVFDSVADQQHIDFIGSWGFPVRLLANLTNMAMRPSIIDMNDGIALIGVAYFISGITLLYAALVSIFSIVRRESEIGVAAGILFFASLAVVSLNPLIQPRYMLPAVAVVMATSKSSRMNSSNAGVILAGVATAAIGIAFYRIAGIAAPDPVSVELWSPF